MIRIRILIFIVITRCHFSYCNIQEGDHLPICIVGAGLSGLNLASLLQAKGHRVQVFEKTMVLGGKVKTLRNPKDPLEMQIEMAPLVYTAEKATYLIDKLNQFNLTSEAFVMDQITFDPQTGAISNGNITKQEKAEILKAYGNKYGQLREAYANQLHFGYLNASKDLFVPFSEWLEKRDLQALKPFFVRVVTAEGLGALEETPALAILKFIDEKTLLGYSGKPGNLLRVKEGLDTLVDSMARSLPKGTIFVGREVDGILRHHGHQILTFVNGEPAICKNVILAHPPLLSKIRHIVHDLSHTERRVLGAVRIHRYFSAANRVPILNESVYISSNMVGHGEPTAFLKQSTLRVQNLFSSYSWIRGNFKSPSTQRDFQHVVNKLSNTMKKIDPNGYTLLVQSYEYFPHFSTHSLKAGFYKALDAIQGHKGLYYATTLLGFENMNGALEMTNGFVKRYF